MLMKLLEKLLFLLILCSVGMIVSGILSLAVKCIGLGTYVYTETDLLLLGFIPLLIFGTAYEAVWNYNWKKKTGGG